MIRLANALADLATDQGAVVRVASPVAEITVKRGRASGVRLTSGEQIEADAIVCNADCGALVTGLFGGAVRKSVQTPKERSLSAVTWTMQAKTSGFPLTRHNVFFGGNYPEEFDAVFRRGRLPHEPTVYVCAQDRPNTAPDTGPERLLILVNAPANGDRTEISPKEIEQCATRTFGLMERCGLTMQHENPTVTTPARFEKLFPATGGALYGTAVHGSMAAFRRPGSRSAIPGLYLAGGSVHPGPGVPMAILSGRLAASSVLQDLTSA
jgi:1-hydroxycarotenoid 3,4-desaturase